MLFMSSFEISVFVNAAILLMKQQIEDLPEGFLYITSAKFLSNPTETLENTTNALK